MSRPTFVVLLQNGLLSSNVPVYDLPLIVTVNDFPTTLSALLILIKEARWGVHGNVFSIVAVIGGNGATATRPSVVKV